jgi:U3 small nucleolar RNA-associated protein 14
MKLGRYSKPSNKKGVLKQRNLRPRIDNEEQEELSARLIGENEDDEQVPSDDDEEVDSDAAFEESDEERFAGFFLHKVCNIFLTLLKCL